MAAHASRPVADFSLETEARLAGLWPVAGVDEVGRGPLCGPVTAAAVVLDPDLIPPGIGDSKTLSAAKREALAGAIMATARSWSVAHATVAEIDTLNILPPPAASGNFARNRLAVAARLV